MIETPAITKQIRQHNAITSARYEMSACEMDIVFCLLGTLKPSGGQRYLISIKQIEGNTGRRWNYQQLRQATERLGSRMYEIEDDERILQLWLLASAEYKKGQGMIELEISEKIKPYLIDLKERFTSYSLKAALNLSSKYAKRIYQLASQWKSVGEKAYSIDELKYMLNLKDPKGKKKEKYTQIAELRRYVLDVAVEQINKHTDLNIEYKLSKIGRSFKNIRFSISRKTEHDRMMQFEPDSEADQALFDRLVEKFALRPDQAIIVMERYDAKAVHKQLYQIDILIKDRKVKNIGAYTAKVFNV